ncbi:MAG: YegS/Rv2252/BmrU family lipid kinase [Eubacteriales bacterium]|nr:YegS/Rv2252/BmrU family lipid kinase [Eubacteriales bacterium]
MKNVLLIINPKSGKGTIRSRLLDISDIFIKAGYDLTIYISQHPGDARAKICKVGKFYDMVVCSGGDGTLDEVVSGMMECEKKCPIGYIPSGSTNDFANSLKIPKNMITAAKRITEENEFPCDIGRFNNDYFVYIAAFGLFTDVSYETPQDMKNVLGHMAYLLKGVEKLTAIKSYDLTAVLDGTEVSGKFIYGMITNSTSVGGFRNITGKHVKLDDGVFEVTLIRMPKDILELQAILTALLTGKPNEKYMYQMCASHIEIVSEKEFPWTLDGEYGGEHTKVEIHNDMKALSLLI